MGVAYSDQKTKWDQNDPTSKIKTNELGGRIRIAYGSFTAAGEQSDIQMFNLPNGARLLSCQVVHPAMGGSTTISVGHAAYKNSGGTAVAEAKGAYKAAAASTSVTTVGGMLTLALGLNTVVNADETGLPVSVSLAGGDGTGKIEITVTYALD